MPASDTLSGSIGQAAATGNASPFKYGDLSAAARAYVSLVASAGTMSPQELEEWAAGMVSSKGLLYKADGRVYKEDRLRTPSELASVLIKQHAAYKHLAYDPVAIAADEATGIVFLAIYYELDNIGPHMGRLPSDKISRGVLIEELQFEASPFRLASSLLCRPFTREEAAAEENLPQGTDVAPLKWHVLPADVTERDLIGPPLPDGADAKAEADLLMRQIQMWTKAWDTTADLSLVDQALAEDVQMVDGYCSSKGKHGRVFVGRDEAKKQVKKAHDDFSNTNKLVAAAVSRERRVGFQHWRSAAVERSTGKPAPLEGVGLLVFDESRDQPRIKQIVEFGIKPTA